MRLLVYSGFTHTFTACKSVTRQASLVNVNDLTVAIVNSYANACRELFEWLELFQEDGYDLLVVPSRGAHPFIAAARSYEHFLRSKQHDDSSVPRLRYLKELYLPFTADISSDQSISSSAIRRYWTRVLAAILRQRENDPAYRFYTFLRSNAGELAMGDTCLGDRKDGRFLFIDTVVSGRAISEIFDAFSESGLNDCYFVLLLDESGKGLRTEYKSKIEAMVRQNRAITIPMELIFTEDEGPAMSGIWTVTLPDLMQATQQKVSELGQSGEFAATLFYWEVSQRPDGSNRDMTVSNALLSTLLHTAVRGDNKATGRLLEMFQNHVSRTKIQRQDKTQAVAAPKILKHLQIDNTDVSSSHVIRGFMDKRRVEKLVQAFIEQSRNSSE